MEFNEFEDLYNFAKHNGYEKTKELLKQYVDDGQPDEFMPFYTTRAMCRCAAMGLNGIHPDRYGDFSYSDLKYGMELHCYMWGGVNLPIEDIAND